MNSLHVGVAVSNGEAGLGNSGLCDGAVNTAFSQYYHKHKQNEFLFFPSHVLWFCSSVVTVARSRNLN